MTEHQECMQLFLGEDEVQVKAMWARIKGQTNRGDIVVGVYYRLPDQEEKVDEAFYRQMQVGLH